MTAITVNIPNRKVSFFKRLMTEMGFTYQMQDLLPRLYDPETGDYLNDETMQAIEDARSGKDPGTVYKSFEDFERAMRSL